jgi:hypothetical protein
MGGRRRMVVVVVVVVIIMRRVSGVRWPMDVQLLESNNGDPSAMDEDDMLMQQEGPVGPAEFEELGVRHMHTHPPTPHTHRGRETKHTHIESFRASSHIAESVVVCQPPWPLRGEGGG